ncbi:oxygenase MpaB family protein [Sphingomonas morindae]|uniref:Oxygenase MpaB family protein n=1 Tax=Sphingomonas morindae TaxID=1541170 RepID=A0ABY4X3I6_9SPHN|nr:oxygenase MpaB family protein [Sphingomonas morindae]USI71450.1 oxygenase MpaB family protein [Sphingomonas morindae]
MVSAAAPAAGPAGALKHALARAVTDIFHDPARGDLRVARRADGLFGPRSVAWRVHGDVTGMTTGGIAGLLMQMLHPAALAGVWDHSSFRADLLGRLRRTVRFIETTTYGSRVEAEAAIARVRAIHARIAGRLADGTPYSASDPTLLAWVHVCESWCFLAGWRHYAEPRMPVAAQDRYFAELARVGAALGADPVPRSRAEAAALIAALRPALRVDARTRETAALILRAPAPTPGLDPLRRLTLRAACALLPPWARRMHGFAEPRLPAPLLTAGTRAMGAAVRWALA